MATAVLNEEVQRWEIPVRSWKKPVESELLYILERIVVPVQQDGKAHLAAAGADAQRMVTFKI